MMPPRIASELHNADKALQRTRMSHASYSANESLPTVAHSASEQLAACYRARSPLIHQRERASTLGFRKIWSAMHSAVSIQTSSIHYRWSRSLFYDAGGFKFGLAPMHAERGYAVPVLRQPSLHSGAGSAGKLLPRIVCVLGLDGALLLLLRLLGALVQDGSGLLLERLAVHHVLLDILLELLLRLALVLVGAVPARVGVGRPRRLPRRFLRDGRLRVLHELRVTLLLLQKRRRDPRHLLLDLAKVLEQVVVGQRRRQLFLEPERLQRVDDMLDRTLAVDLRLPEPLPPVARLFERLLGDRRAVAIRVARVARGPALRLLLLHFSQGELQLANRLLLLGHGVAQRVDARLRLACHGEQVLMGLLLREELLDHLVDVGHVGRLLDLLERRLVRGDLPLLRLDELLRLLRLRLGALFAHAACRLVQHRLAFFLALLELLSELLLFMQHLPTLLQLLLAQLPLLGDDRLELGQFGLGDFL
mmetsp:Transcript_49330/g.106853  ORF Transcript_49330/g.106853 Transcript_49330/m.106853 type:complete len:477 (-) Transcript_49330:43-1473(-)